MAEIKYVITQKKSAIDLIDWKIRMEDALVKSFKQIDQLIKQNWQYIGLNKSEKKSLCDGLESYVKAGKKNKKKQNSCLSQITKA